MRQTILFILISTILLVCSGISSDFVVSNQPDFLVSGNELSTMRTTCANNPFTAQFIQDKTNIFQFDSDSAKVDSIVIPVTYKNSIVATQQIKSLVLDESHIFGSGIDEIKITSKTGNNQPRCQAVQRFRAETDIIDSISAVFYVENLDGFSLSLQSSCGGEDLVICGNGGISFEKTQSYTDKYGVYTCKLDNFAVNKGETYYLCFYETDGIGINGWAFGNMPTDVSNYGENCNYWEYGRNYLYQISGTAHNYISNLTITATAPGCLVPVTLFQGSGTLKGESTLQYNADALASRLSCCTPDQYGNCTIDIYASSDYPGILELKSLNLAYTDYKWSEFIPFQSRYSGFDITDEAYGCPTEDGPRTVLVQTCSESTCSKEIQEFDLFLDRVAPQGCNPALENTVNGWSASKDLTFSFSCVDAVTKQLGCGSQRSWEIEYTDSWGPLALGSLPGCSNSDGIQTLVFEFNDTAGNVAEEALYIRIDTTPPESDATPLGKTFVGDELQTFTVTAQDVGSGLDLSSAQFCVSTDGTCDTEWTSTGITKGADCVDGTITPCTFSLQGWRGQNQKNYTVSFKVADKVGHSKELETPIMFQTDFDGPNCEVSVNPNIVKPHGTVKLHITCTKEGVSAQTSTGIPFTLQTDGSMTAQYKVDNDAAFEQISIILEDLAGNVQMQFVSVQIDGIPPVCMPLQVAVEGNDGAQVGEYIEISIACPEPDLTVIIDLVDLLGFSSFYTLDFNKSTSLYSTKILLTEEMIPKDGLKTIPVHTLEDIAGNKVTALYAASVLINNTGLPFISCNDRTCAVAEGECSYCVECSLQSCKDDGLCSVRIENCANSPQDCVCGSGSVCNIDDVRRDEKGCVYPQCHDNVCDISETYNECSILCGDCTNEECLGDGVCNKARGETQDSAPDDCKSIVSIKPDVSGKAIIVIATPTPKPPDTIITTVTPTPQDSDGRCIEDNNPCTQIERDSDGVCTKTILTGTFCDKDTVCNYKGDCVQCRCEPDKNECIRGTCNGNICVRTRRPCGALCSDGVCNSAGYCVEQRLEGDTCQCQNMCGPGFYCVDNVCKSNLCGDGKCQNECDVCPDDCTDAECSENGVCDTERGENCIFNENDCACGAGLYCGSEALKGEDGCKKIVCGDDICVEGIETSSTCCVDCQCPDNYVCDEGSSMCIQEQLPAQCGNNICERGECSGCPIDCSCEQCHCEIKTETKQTHNYVEGEEKDIVIELVNKAPLVQHFAVAVRDNTDTIIYEKEVRLSGNSMYNLAIPITVPAEQTTYTVEMTRSSDNEVITEKITITPKKKGFFEKYQLFFNMKEFFEVIFLIVTAVLTIAGLRHRSQKKAQSMPQRGQVQYQMPRSFAQQSQMYWRR